MRKSLLLIPVLSIFLFASCASSDKNKKDNTEQVESLRIDMDYTCETSFTDKEMLSISDDSILYYCDIESGISVPICSKPDCKHLGASLSNPNPDCNGYVSGTDTSCIALLNDKLYFLYTPDSDSSDYSGFSDKVLCRAEKDGTERKTIAEISNAQTINSAYYGNDCLVIGYSNTFDEQGNNLDKSSSYASVIDLSDGNIASTPKKEGFQGQIRNVYYEKDVVYFSYFYLTEQVDYTKWDVDSDEFADYVNGIEKTDIIRYDMKNNKEEIVWSGSGACEDMNYGYACIKEQTEQAPKAIKLSDGEVIDLGKQFYDCTFTIDDTGIIVSDYDNSKYLFYDFDKKEMTDIGSVNQSDYLMMTAVTDSNYYVSYYLDSDFVLGYISKEDFLKGQLENVSKVKSYNS